MRGQGCGTPRSKFPGMREGPDLFWHRSPRSAAPAECSAIRVRGALAPSPRPTLHDMLGARRGSQPCTGLLPPGVRRAPSSAAGGVPWVRGAASHGSTTRCGRDVLGRQAASTVGSCGLEWAALSALHLHLGVWRNAQRHRATLEYAHPH